MPIRLRDVLPKVVYKVLKKHGPLTARQIHDYLQDDERQNIRRASSQKIAGALLTNPKLFYQYGFDNYNRTVWYIIDNRQKCLMRRNKAIKLLRETNKKLGQLDIQHSEVDKTLNEVEDSREMIRDVLALLRCKE